MTLARHDSPVAAAMYSRGAVPECAPPADYHLRPRCGQDWITDIHAGHAGMLSQPADLRLNPGS